MERFTCREDKVSVGGTLTERACSVWTLTAGTLATAGIRLQVLPKQGFKSCGLRVGKELLQPEVPVWAIEVVLEEPDLEAMEEKEKEDEHQTGEGLY